MSEWAVCTTCSAAVAITQFLTIFSCYLHRSYSLGSFHLLQHWFTPVLLEASLTTQSSTSSSWHYNCFNIPWGFKPWKGELLGNLSLQVNTSHSLSHLKPKSPLTLGSTWMQPHDPQILTSWKEKQSHTGQHTAHPIQTPSITLVLTTLPSFGFPWIPGLNEHS